VAVLQRSGPESGGVVNRHSRRVEHGHVRHSGNRVSPAIWLAVPTRFPPAWHAHARHAWRRSSRIPGRLPAC